MAPSSASPCLRSSASPALSPELLEDAVSDAALQEQLARLARLGRAGLTVWGPGGELAWSAGATHAPVSHAWRRELVVEGAVVGLVAAQCAQESEPADLLDAAAHVLCERLRAELEKNALADEILTKLQELNTLYEVSANLANARDVAAVGTEVLQRAMGTIAPDWGAFVAYDPERSQFRIISVVGARDGLSRGWRVVEQDSHVWIAMNSGEPVLVPEVTEADRIRLKRDIGPIAERATSMLAVPTCASHQPLGALVLLAGPTRPAFTSVDAKLLMAMASQAAVAAGHLRLYEGSKEMFLSTVWSLASAIDAKDAYTHGHSQRVARYAAALGRAVGFDEQEVERLELSAVLHDVGKIGVPEAILNKPDRLTAAEMAVMKTHPQKGAEILSSIRAMRDIVPGVLHHHERFDGLGYPNGLKSHNIPLHARIILVADTFDAMTSSRPYRLALPLNVAIGELKRCTGTQFDPRLSETMITLIQRGLVKPAEGAELGSCDAFEGDRP